MNKQQISRRAALAGVLATAAVATTGAATAEASTYGSGALGWTPAMGGHSVSDDPTFENAPVWQFGDSIAFNDQKPLAQQLYDRLGMTLAVDNWRGIPTAPAVEALVLRVGKHGPPPVIVMATGSNDVFSPPGLAHQVERVYELVGTDSKILWVNTYVGRTLHPQATRESDIRNTGWINAQIAGVVAKYGNMRVVPWFETLAANPGYRLTNWLTDGLHTSPLGQLNRNTMQVDAIDAVT